MKQKRGTGNTACCATSQRLDKWLWYTRIVKSRTLAAVLVGGGKVRVNRERVVKASFSVKPGDVVTASVAKKVRILKVLAPGFRRGPAVEARELYEDLTPEVIASTSVGAKREGGVETGSVVFERVAGAGRPTKRDRRKIDRFKNQRGE